MSGDKCTCGESFRTAEDWRDHMPCDGRRDAFLDGLSDIEGDFFGAKRDGRNVTPAFDTNPKDFAAEIAKADDEYAEYTLTRGPRPAPQEPAKDSKIAAASKKVPLNMIPMRILKGVARVFQFGAKKHGRGNFLKGTDDGAVDRYTGGCLRHVADCQGLDGVWDWQKLAKIDDESGLYELDHAICGLIMLRGIAIAKGVMKEDPGEAPGMAALMSRHMGEIK